MQAWKQYTPIATNRNANRDLTAVEEAKAKTGMVMKGLSENMLQDSGNNNFKVVIRIRPPLERETTPNVPFQSTVSDLLIYASRHKFQLIAKCARLLNI